MIWKFPRKIMFNWHKILIVIFIHSSFVNGMSLRIDEDDCCFDACDCLAYWCRCRCINDDNFCNICSQASGEGSTIRRSCCSKATGISSHVECSICVQALGAYSQVRCACCAIVTGDYSLTIGFLSAITANHVYNFNCCRYISPDTEYSIHPPFCFPRRPAQGFNEIRDEEEAPLRQQMD